MTGRSLALPVHPDDLAVIQVEFLDGPAVEDHEHRVFVDRHGGRSRRSFSPSVVRDDRPAVLGPEHQQLIGPVDLETIAIGADPEIGIDLARRSRERPVDRTGVAVEGEQLAGAAQAEDAALTSWKPGEPRPAGLAARAASPSSASANGSGRSQLLAASGQVDTATAPSPGPGPARRSGGAVAAISLSAR